MREFGAGNRGFGWRAAKIDATATKVFAFGKHHLLARLGECIRQRNTRLSTADDDDIQIHGFLLLNYQLRAL